jgi:aryl-alcohol dehydrogenase-like predicted oxidoreductase
VGGYHVGWTSERDAQAVIETALAAGIRFFDTAHNYADGESENRYGRYLTPNHRQDIFLMTKSQAGDYKAARAELELSLRRLNTDHVDLWQLHSLESPDDVDARIRNGVLRACEEALNEGKARYLGFTGHASPYAHLRILDQTAGSGLFSTTQMPVNVLDAASERSFIRQVVPRAIERNLGILAMKTLADGRFFGSKTQPAWTNWQTDDPVVPTRVSAEDALRFAWSLPISVLITGAETPAMLEEKVAYARRFAALTETDRTVLIDRIANLPGRDQVEYYKTPIAQPR